MYGTKIRIGIIDSGFDEKYYKIQNKIIKKYNIRKEIGNIDDNIQDEYGHGTGILKIIDDICDDVEFVVFKILDEKCQGTDRQLIEALKLAVLENVDIINISLGTTNKKVELCIKNLCDIAEKKGIIIVSTCPNDMEQLSWPYELESVIKVKANAKITNFDVYYDKDNIFWGRGIHHLIPWIEGNCTYSASNSFSTPYIVAKIVDILKKNKKIEKKRVIEKLKEASHTIAQLNELTIRREECHSFGLLKIVEEILKRLLGKNISDIRLTLQGMTPELSVEVLKEIENKCGMPIKYSVYNYIDFEYVENIVNRIVFIKD